MDEVQKKAFALLTKYRRRLTRQQVTTLKGQILAGDPIGAVKGLKKLTVLDNEQEVFL